MEGQLNYNALSCYCTQTDSVRIAGEYPLAPKGKPKRRAPTTRQQQERTQAAAAAGGDSEPVEEPLVQWRWAAAELACDANNNEQEVVISDPGPSGVFIEQSSSGRPVVGGFARAHDKGCAFAKQSDQSFHQSRLANPMCNQDSGR
jgi:hypothetical protein